MWKGKEKSKEQTCQLSPPCSPGGCGAGPKTFQGLWIKLSSSIQTNSTEGESVCLAVFLGGYVYIEVNLVNGKQHEQAGFNPLNGEYASEQGNEWDSLTKATEFL